MRLHLLGLAASIMLGGTPAQAAARNFTVTGFDRIRVDGPYRVELRTGVAPFATAEGSPAALDALSLEVQGRTLIIRRKSTAASSSPQRAGPVAVSAGTHELAAAWLNGSGGLAIDAVKGQAFELGVSGSGAAQVGKVGVDRLGVAISGSASAVLGGTAATATFSIRGPSTLDASALTTKDARIAGQGASTIKLTATGTAKVDARGLATVELAGGPACTIAPASTAEVSGCR